MRKRQATKRRRRFHIFFFLSFCPFCWCCIVVYSMAAFSISLFVRMVAFDKSCPSENSFHRARTAHSTIGNARARTLLSSRVRNQLSNRMNIFFVQLRCSASCEGQNRRHFFHLFEWDAVVAVFSCSHFTWFSLFWNIASRQHYTHTHTQAHTKLLHSHSRAHPSVHLMDENACSSSDRCFPSSLRSSRHFVASFTRRKLSYQAKH